MKDLHRRLIGSFCVSAIFLCSLTASGEEATRTRTANKRVAAEVAAGVSRVDWMLREPAGAVLTVSGPGGVVERQEFQSGAPILFSTTARDGSRRPDGVYTWELSVVRPHDPGAFRSLGDGEESADGRRIEARATAGMGREPDSGSFWIQNGAVVAGGLVEPAPARRPKAAKAGAGAGVNTAGGGGVVPLDQVIADDLIVQGSACVGLDCVNGEAFSFDTIRLKENNTRISFNDTSVGAFPANDWTIRANSSASGGGNFLAFVDRGADSPGDETGTIVFQVDAGAPASALVVDSTGRVGLRTSTPVLDVHAVTGNTPALRLDQSSAGGFTAQTWDIAANEANFFVRDVTGGSRLPLRIRPGAPTSAIDIAANGWVGINNSSPQGNLDIHNSSATADTFCGIGVDLVAGPAFNFGYAGSTFGRGAGFFNVRPDASAVAPNPSLRFMTANVLRMIVTNLGYVGIGMSNPTHPLEMASGAWVTAGGVWTNASTREAKDDIRELTTQEAIDLVRDLSPVAFVYKAAPNEQHLGFIAEDVPAPLASPDRKGMSPMDVVAVLTKVIQEQGRKLEEQSRAFEELRSRFERLESGTAGSVAP